MEVDSSKRSTTLTTFISVILSLALDEQGSSFPHLFGLDLHGTRNGVFFTSSVSQGSNPTL